MGPRIIKVIDTELELRGDGKTDPFRRIHQIYDLEGNLIMEKDPCHKLGQDELDCEGCSHDGKKNTEECNHCARAWPDRYKGDLFRE
jgi:hypothetical protein